MFKGKRGLAEHTRSRVLLSTDDEFDGIKDLKCSVSSDLSLLAE